MNITLWLKCFWVWTLVSDIEGRTYSEGVLEQGVEEKYIDR
jgi:hypothetical protein